MDSEKQKNIDVNAGNRNSTSREPGNENGVNNDYDLVRNLLLGFEKQQIDEILNRLNNPKILSEEISKVLPEAVRLSLTKGDRLHRSLIPVINKAIEENAHSEPYTLINIIYSLIGPATRKAVAEALKSMMQSINSAMGSVFSINGIKWRFQSFITHKPFSEIVLINNLIYQIDQVFLIHKETSLLLEEAKLDTASSQDPDLISSMLRAIQDFVKDSFKLKAGESLNNLNVGELTVWIEEGPNAVLAAVVRGQAPEELRSKLAEVLEKIHREYGDELNNFDGDIDPFKIVKSDLESCLAQKLQTDSKPKPKYFNYSLIALGILLLVGGFFFVRNAIRWNGFINQLKEEKGIVLMDDGGRLWNKYLVGMRDPLATDPTAIAEKYNIEPDDIEFSLVPYQSLEPEIIVKRAYKILKPQSGLLFRFSTDTLFAEGGAAREWVEEAQAIAKALPGVNCFDISKLKHSYGIVEDSLINIIESQNFLFYFNSTEMLPEQSEKFELIKETLHELIKVTKDKIIYIDIAGHSCSSGSEDRNEKISWLRAKYIFDLMTSKQLRRVEFSLNAMGKSDPFVEETGEENRSLNRRVNLKIKLGKI